MRPSLWFRLGKICFLPILLLMIPGLALAITARPEKPPCVCTLRGHVVSWSCIWEDLEPVFPYKLPNVEVEYRDCLGGSAKATTDEKGYFEFKCVPNPTSGCPFCFRLTDVDHTGYITAFDASLILRYLVRLETLDRCPFDTGSDLLYPQMLAADVNCQMGVNAYDAALILKYLVGLIDHFDCPDAWVYFPEPDCVEECAQDVLLYCIYVGDVSGPSSGPSLLAAETAPVVRFGPPSHYSQYVRVPVRVSGAKNVYSAEFTMAFNPMDFDVVGVERGALTQGYSLMNNALGGLLYVAMAGVSPFSGDGDIAVITLEKKHPMIVTALNKLLLSDVLLNEFEPVVADVAPGTPEIFKLSLGPVSPNPASGSADIWFEASGPCRVALSIYSVEGELVRTVFDGDVEAGRKSVTWDGSDSHGSPVARGIYFCRVESGDAAATEKIALIR